MLKEKEEKQIKTAPVCNCEGHGKHTPPAPGRKITGDEANARILKKNAELYARLAR